MTQDILAGRVDIHASRNRGGELGTWILGVGHQFDNRKALIDNICTMLNRDWYTQNYIGTYLLPLLPQLADTASREARLKAALKNAIENDARIIKQKLGTLPLSWRRSVSD